MAVSADPQQFISGSSDGNETLTAPTGPSGVSVNGGPNDILIGSAGDNIFYVNYLNDVVQVASGLGGVKTIIASSNGYTLPDNVQNLTFYGAGNWGVGNGLDNLISMGGNDVNYMDGGRGDDVMVGGFGQNNFGVEAGNGNDVIYNFHVSQDTVRMPGTSFTSFAQVKAAMVQQGPDVVLHIDSNETLTFRGVSVADFQAKNFMMPLDASKLGALTFDDEFNSLQLFDSATGQGHWQTNFGGDPNNIDTYTLTGNQEGQVYTDAKFQGTSGHPLGYNPFSINSGVLDITAQRFSYADSQYTFGQAYSSGMLTTRGIFAQKYGYFEMKAELPTGLGTWPAFWLSQDPYKPGVEADVLEHLAMYPDTVFSRVNDAGAVTGATNVVTPSLSGFHTYGMLWTATTTSLYVDGIEVMELPTPASWDQPMYMLVNLAIGGWGGPIDQNGLPAHMNVDYVRVYGLADHSQVLEQTIDGGSGDDVLDAGVGNNIINGQGGVNTITFNAATVGVKVDLDHGVATVGANNDTLVSIQNAVGTAYDDIFISGAGPNHFDGNGGLDTVSYADSTTAVTVNLGAGTSSDGAVQDSFTGISAVIGSNYDDTLIGGPGNGSLKGGLGADTFVVAPAQGARTVIADFSAAQGDRIDLSAFTGVHSLNDLAAHVTASGADTLITFDTGSVTLTGVTPGSLSAAQFLFAPGGGTPPPVPRAPADFNHDGVSDVLLRDNTTGDFGYMALTPLGGASWHPVGGSNANYGLFAVADFNGDGASDMLLRNDATGDVGYMDMTPSGGPVWHDIGGSAVSYTVQGTGDFNGDHVTDMLWRNDTTGDVGYTALTSSGGASWVHLGNSSTAYTVEGTGDFNGDGVSDLLFRNESTGDVGYTALTPYGGARWVYLGGSATAYAVQGSGDFNGDGVSDLLFRNQSTGDYGYTALTPSGGATWHALGISDPTYAIVATGDFNGDGMADVLQRNTTSGDYGYMATSGSTGVWHDIGVTDASHFII
jgi:beta-glucanase (GH16 family)